MPPLPSSLEGHLCQIVLETIGPPVVVLDEEARIRLFNPAAERLSGYAAEELIGKEIWPLVHPSHRAEALLLFRRILASEEEGPIDVDWQSREGTRIHLRWAFSPVLDPEAGGRLLVCAGLDTTPRARLEERNRELETTEQEMRDREALLRSSEARLSGIIELASDGIIAVNEAHEIVLFNQGARTIFGYEAEEVLGRPLDILIPERARSTHTQHMRTFADSSIHARRMGERREISGRRKGGEEFPAEASILKLEVDGERLLSVVLRDVTERHRVETAQTFLAGVGEVLTSSLDQDTLLRRLADLSVEGLADFCAIDLLGEGESLRRFVVSHRGPEKGDAAARLAAIELDRSRPHLVSHVLETEAPHLVEKVTRRHLAKLAQGSKHLEVLMSLEAQSYMVLPIRARGHLLGALLLVSSRGSRPFDEQHLELGMELATRAGLALDNARLYRDAQRAVQARDDVLGVVSHDLGNPLQAVFIALEAMERARTREGEGEEDYYLTAIRKSADLMQRLIHELLEVRRMEEAQLALEPVEQPLAPLVREALAVIEPLARVKGVELVDEVTGAELPAVLTDGDRLQQVISNLVGNAVKHTPGGGTVRISAAMQRGEGLVVEVSDTGAGIPEEHLDQVFERFWKAEKTGGRGIGLGLAIARGIVKAHGGRIWVESVVGEGSVFRFSLPHPSDTTG